MRRFWPLTVLFGLVVATVVLAQVLGPGEYSTMLIEGDTTMGDGTAKDITITFDDDAIDCTLGWDDSESRIVISGCEYKVTGATGAGAGMVFSDGDSAAPLDGSFVVNATDTTGSSEDAEFEISTIFDGAFNTRVKIREYDVGASGATAYIVSGFEGIIGYSGTTNDRNMFYDGGTYHKFQQELVLDGAAGDQVILISPDGSCSSCGPDDSDVWACTAATCP